MSDITKIIQRVENITASAEEAVKASSLSLYKKRIQKAMGLFWNYSLPKIAAVQQRFIESISCANHTESKEVRKKLDTLKRSIVELRKDPNKYFVYSRFEGFLAIIFPFIFSNRDQQRARFANELETNLVKVNSAIEKKIEQLKEFSREEKAKEKAATKLQTLYAKIPITSGVSQNDQKALQIQLEKQLTPFNGVQKLQIVEQLTGVIDHSSVAELDENDRISFSYYLLLQKPTLQHLDPVNLIGKYRKAKKDKKLPPLAQQALTGFQHSSELKRYFTELATFLDKKDMDELWQISKKSFEPRTIKQQATYLTLIKETIAYAEHVLVPARKENADSEMVHFKRLLLTRCIDTVLATKPKGVVAQYTQQRQDGLKNAIALYQARIPNEYEGLHSLCHRICNGLSSLKTAEQRADGLVTLENLLKMMIISDSGYQFPSDVLKAFKLDPKARAKDLPKIADAILSNTLNSGATIIQERLTAYQNTVLKPADVIAEDLLRKIGSRSKLLAPKIEANFTAIKQALLEASEIVQRHRWNKERRAALSAKLPFIGKLKKLTKMKILTKLEQAAEKLMEFRNAKGDFDTYTKRYDSIDKGWKTAQTPEARIDAYTKAMCDLFEKEQGRGKVLDCDERALLSYVLFCLAKDQQLLRTLVSVLAKSVQNFYGTDTRVLSNVIGAVNVLADISNRLL